MRKSLRVSGCLCLVAVMMTGSAAQAGWKLVSRAAAGQKVSVDDTSFQKNGMLINVWTKVTPPPALAGSIDAANAVSQQTSPEYAEGLPYLMEVSCSDKLIRLSAAAQTSTQPNPFGPADSSPYTFQPINNSVAYAVYGAACQSASVASAPKPLTGSDDPSLNITPRRTIAPKNPWSYTVTRGY